MSVSFASASVRICILSSIGKTVLAHQIGNLRPAMPYVDNCKILFEASNKMFTDLIMLLAALGGHIIKYYDVLVCLTSRSSTLISSARSFEKVPFLMSSP